MKSIVEFINESLETIVESNGSFEQTLTAMKYKFTKEVRDNSEYESTVFDCETWEEYIIDNLDFDYVVSFAYCPETNEFALFVDSQQAIISGNNMEIGDDEAIEFNDKTIKDYSLAKVKKLCKMYDNGDI